jgi:hypothetical protein
LGGERRGAKGGAAIFPGARPGAGASGVSGRPAASADCPAKGWSGEQSPLDC